MDSPSSHDRWRSLGKIQQFAWVNCLSYLYSRQVKLLSYLIGRTLEARLPTSYLISGNVWHPICQKRRPENLSLATGPAVAVAAGHQKNDAGIKNKGCVCVCVHVRVSVCMHSGPASLNRICSWSEHCSAHRHSRFISLKTLVSSLD